MNVILFVVGPPGVGKTTLVRGLLEPDSYLVKSPKWTVGDTVCAAGHYSGGTFDGADTVPYNGVKACLEYWRVQLAHGKKLTIFDGDRFSNAGVVAYFRGVLPAVRIVCVHVGAPEAVLRERWAERGSKQNETWVKGRITKAKRFAESFGQYIELDGREPTAALLTKLNGEALLHSGG